MKKTWRAYILVIAITIFSGIYSIPNIFGEAPAVELTQTSGGRITDRTFSKVKNTLKQQSLTFDKIDRTRNKIILTFNDPAAQIKAKDLIAKYYGTMLNSNLNLVSKSPAWLSALGANPMKLGLDLRGGIHLLLSVDINSMLRAGILGI